MNLQKNLHILFLTTNQYQPSNIKKKKGKTKKKNGSFMIKTMASSRMVFFFFLSLTQQTSRSQARLGLIFKQNIM
jgi:hypothetical protein